MKTISGIWFYSKTIKTVHRSEEIDKHCETNNKMIKKKDCKISQNKTAMCGLQYKRRLLSKNFKGKEIAKNICKYYTYIEILCAKLYISALYQNEE